MNVKVAFEQRVASYVSLPQGAERVYNALVRDHHVAAGSLLPFSSERICSTYEHICAHVEHI